MDARILVISRTPQLTSEIVVALSGQGYLVTTVDTLENGLEVLARGRYDALILDRNVADRPETLAGIVGDNPAVMGLLICSEKIGEEEEIRLLHHGWTEVLSQPLDREKILVGMTNALRRALQAREKIRAATLAPLAEISRDFLLTLDLDELLERIVDVAKQEARCDRVSLMLVEGQELIIRAAVGLDRQALERWRGKVGVGIAGFTAASGDTVIINHGEEDRRFLEHLRDDQIKSALSLPLKVRRKVIGVLNLTNFMGRDRFLHSDVQFLSLLAGQAAVAIQNANLYNSLQTSYLHTIVGLANALEARDASLSGHSTKVLNHAVKIARKLGVAEQLISDIRNAAMLHDIGKIGIRDAILLKPGKLDESEWRILKTHPEVGGNIVAPVRHLARCVPLILHHHERWDGNGYPSRLAAEDIPLGSRIIAVADTYDAMTSIRPYRTALAHESAVMELEKVAGSQLDPACVAAFLAILRDDASDAVEP